MAIFAARTLRVASSLFVTDVRCEEITRGHACDQCKVARFERRRTEPLFASARGPLRQVVDALDRPCASEAPRDMQGTKNDSRQSADWSDNDALKTEVSVNV